MAKHSRADMSTCTERRVGDGAGSAIILIPEADGAASSTMLTPEGDRVASSTMFTLEGDGVASSTMLMTEANGAAPSQKPTADHSSTTCNFTLFCVLFTQPNVLCFFYLLPHVIIDC